MASDRLLHQIPWSEGSALVQGPLTLDSISSLSPADAINFDGASHATLAFYANYSSSKDAHSLPISTAFEPGNSSYELAVSDPPCPYYRTGHDIDDAGDPPLHMPGAPFWWSGVSDVWLPMSAANGVPPQQQETYHDTCGVGGDETFATYNLGLLTSAPSSPAAGVLVRFSRHAGAVSASSPAAFLEATIPYATASDPGRSNPPQIPISSERTRENEHGGATGLKKRPRGRPRIYPDVDNGASQWEGALTPTDMEHHSLVSVKAAGPTSMKSPQQTARQRVRNRHAAKRHRDKLQTASDSLEEHAQRLGQVRKSLQSDVRRLRDEVFQLKCILLQDAQCDCPLMRAYTYVKYAASQTLGTSSSSQSNSLSYQLGCLV